MKPTLIILAAGMGSRYGSLKQIEPVGPNNEIIMDYSVYDAIKAGFGKVVFVIKKEMEDVFKEKIGRRIEKIIDTDYVFQDLNYLPEGYTLPAGRVKPWGTAHAVLSCKNVVDTPFGVINADDFYGAHSFKLLASNLTQAKNQEEYCIIGFKLSNTLTDNGFVSRGVCNVSGEGFLTDITERTRIEKCGENGKEARYTEDGVSFIQIDGNSIVSMNMMGFTTGFFNELENRFPKLLRLADDLSKFEYYLPSAVDDIIKDKKARVKVVISDERWFGVTYREDKESVKDAIAQMIHEGKYPVNL